MSETRDGEFLTVGQPPIEEKDTLGGGVTPSLGPVITVAAPLPERVASSVPPDGGINAWLQVAGSFFLFFNTWGLLNAFGSFQSYYSTSLLSSSTPSDISWIGSIQAFLLLLIGVGTGPIYDAGYFRHLVLIGSSLVVIGMVTTSLCTSYWQFMLAQGISIGLGAGCLFVPSVAIVSTYFSTKRSFATGVAASGSSLGGVLYPIILHQLIPRIGFGWATRVLALITLVTLTVPVAVMRMRAVPKARRALIDVSAFHDAPFVLFTVGGFFIFMGLYIPMFYVQSFAIEEEITSENLAFYMLSIINAASVFGRLVPNFMADTSGPLNVLIPCTIVAALLAFCWLAVKNAAGLIVFCLLYGFFTGGLVSLPPTVLVSLSPSMAVVGSRMGTCFAFNGISLLIGTPIAGALVKPGDFKGAIAFCGSVVIFGCIFLILARIVKVGTAVRAKI